MTDRIRLIRKYNPKLHAINLTSPLTVGNGSFAFTADITGMQTLWEDYREHTPLLCQADFGWHSAPDENGKYYEFSDVEMTRYDFCGREVRYPVEKQPGNEKIFDGLRENPHRLNLMRVRLWKDAKPVGKEEISGISQELDLFTGILYSRFTVDGREITVKTAVGNSYAKGNASADGSVSSEKKTSGVGDASSAGKTSGVGFQVSCEKGLEGFSVAIDFPYGSPDITGSDFNAEEKHKTEVLLSEEGKLLLQRTLDRDRYLSMISSDAETEVSGAHCVKVCPKKGSKDLSFIVLWDFPAKNENNFVRPLNDCGVESEQLKTLFFDTVACYNSQQLFSESEARLKDFWLNGGIVDVTASKDPRAEELERRIILSMYLTAVQSLGKTPPQETGLTCNSWYGKFHLEMVPYHLAHFILSGRGHLLEETLSWYQEILPKARDNAARNGYRGARWPKMISPEAVDSPSIIAPLLIWQETHILYLLELLRASRYGGHPVESPGNVTEKEFLQKYRDLVFETAEFLADFPVYDPESDRYNLEPPLIPAQENHPPRETRNPSFELAEWRFGLKTAEHWLKALGEDHPKYREVAQKLAPVFIADGLIEARENCTETYTKYNKDHPSMLFSYGMYSEPVDRKVLLDSLKKFRENWDYLSMWGWDFAMLAMVYAKLGDMDEAYNMLLWETEKNAYVENGNNAQLSRNDLPLYLPGNGSLLMAMSLLGDSSTFTVKKEGILPYPF